MADPYLGEIRLFASNFAPSGWAICNGAILSIAQNTALFSLLGTYYGGNGTTTFALPDLQGRCALGTGNGTGLSAYTLGQKAGAENVALTQYNLPVHFHTFAQNVSDTLANKTGLSGGIPAQVNSGGTGIPNSTHTAATGTYAQQNTGQAGGNQPAPIIQPYLALTYIIALQGIYPSRS